MSDDEQLPDEPTQAYDPIEPHEPDSEELALDALSAGFGNEPPPAAPDGEPARDGDVVSMLSAGHATGKGADTELALATVKTISRNRTIRDRFGIAAVAAAVLLVIVFAAAWDRSSSTSDLETANDGRTPATTARPGTTIGRGITYSGDPDAGSIPSPDTSAGAALPPATDFSTTTTRASSTTTAKAGPDPSTSTPTAPVLQVNIHADSSTYNVGDRAWFNVQVHNSGGEGDYEDNTCFTGTHFKVTVAPTLPSGGNEGVSWDGAPETFAAAVGKGGGRMANGPSVGGAQVGSVIVSIGCILPHIGKPIAPGETLSERVAIDLAPPPGQSLSGTRTITAEFTADTVTASDSTTITIGGNAPALPDAAALQAVASASSVSGWVAAQSKPLVVQTRYYRGAWELILSPKSTSPTTEILRVRLNASGSIIDTRAAQNQSAFSDDPGATAPVVGERVL